MKLRIGADGFALEPGLAEDVVAILGRRGRGKTNTAVVFVEELHAAGARFCVADPVGVWWGLKSSKDGRGAGIPAVVMGGDRTDRRDVPLEEAAGRVIADFVADPSSPSVVLDFRGFRKAQMARFMTDFLEQLYQRNREPLHLVLDEADQFAPQRVMGETARLVGAAEDVCKMGRARGLHPIVITQRPAALNKNVLTQAGLLVCHQLTGPQDQKAVDEWIRANADEAQREKFLATIPELTRGVAWFWQPEVPIFQRVHVRERKTFDSSATPKRGEERQGPRVVALVDLDALKVRIASTIEKAKAEDPRELRKTIADLRAQLQKAQSAKPVAPVAALKPPRIIERPVLKDTQVKRLEAAVARLGESRVKFFEAQHAAAEKLYTQEERVASEMRSVLAALAAARDAQRGAAGRTLAADGRSRAAAPHLVSPADAGASTTRAGSAPPPMAARHSPRRESTRDGLGSGERAVLTAIAQHQEGVSREQLSILTGYKRSSRDTYLQRLRAGGYVDDQAGRLVVTDAGLNALGSDFEPLPTGERLRTYWLEKLPAGEKKLLNELLGAWPNALARDDLDVGFKRSSRDTYLQRLRARQLVKVTDRGQVKASDHLFLEVPHGQ